MPFFPYQICFVFILCAPLSIFFIFISSLKISYKLIMLMPSYNSSHVISLSLVTQICDLFRFCWFFCLVGFWGLLLFVFPSSTVCAALILLNVWPSLWGGVGIYWGHTLKKSWLSLSQQLWITNNCLARDGILYHQQCQELVTRQITGFLGGPLQSLYWMHIVLYHLHLVFK